MYDLLLALAGRLDDDLLARARELVAVGEEGPAVELWAHKVSTEHGFSDVQHTLEIFGTCASCAG